MKSFIKLSYKIIICILFLIGINILFMNTNFWKNQNDVYKFSKIPSNVKLINLGSSHGQAAFDYSQTSDVTAYNFALSAQPFYYDLCVLKQFQHKLSQNAVVLIPISFFSFYQQKTEFDVMKFRYYRILSNKYIIATDLFEDFQYSIFPISSQGRSIRHIIKDIPLSETDFCTSELQQKIVDQENINARAKMKIQNRFGANRETVSEAEFNLNYSSFIDLLEFCNLHNYKAILLTTPLTTELYNLFSSEYLTEFTDILSGVLNQYKNIEYWNYVQFPLISNNLSYFRDSDHLNRRGALEFTQIIIDRLKEQGYLE